MPSPPLSQDEAVFKNVQKYSGKSVRVKPPPMLSFHWWDHVY